MVRTGLRKVVELLGLMAVFSGPTIAYGAEEAAGSLLSPRPLAAPIIENGRIGGQLRVSVKLIPESASDAEEISARLPALQSALVAAVSEFARLNVSVFKPVNASRLRSYLVSQVRAKGFKVKDVLIMDVVAF